MSHRVAANAGFYSFGCGPSGRCGFGLTKCSGEPAVGITSGVVAWLYKSGLFQILCFKHTMKLVTIREFGFYMVVI